MKMPASPALAARHRDLPPPSARSWRRVIPRTDVLASGGSQETRTRWLPPEAAILTRNSATSWDRGDEAFGDGQPVPLVI